MRPIEKLHPGQNVTHMNSLGKMSEETIKPDYSFYGEAKMPLVSVIVPNYNHARFLDERMETILGQTYQNFEVIILDDKSTDESKEVIERYRGNAKVSAIVYNEENSGSPFKQWYKGFQLCKGEIVWIAESDDSCEPTFLESLVPCFADEHVAFAFCRTTKVDEAGKPFEVCQPDMHGSYVMEGRDFIARHLYRICSVVNASSALIRKHMALSTAPLYQEFRGSGDWMFWIEMAELGHVAFVDKKLNRCRQFFQSTTAKMQRSMRSSAEDYRIYQYMITHKEMSRAKALKTRFWRIYSLLFYTDGLDAKKRKEGLRIWRSNAILHIFACFTRLYVKVRTGE